jgi:hypothetical protein
MSLTRWWKNKKAVGLSKGFKIKKNRPVMVWVWNIPQKFICWGLGPQSSSVQRRGLCKWWDHEGSEVINGLTHWWIPSSMGYWEVMETLGGGAQMEEVGPSFYFPIAMRWAAFLHHEFPVLMFCLTPVPETMEPSDRGQKLLKSEPKHIFPSLNYSPLVFRHSEEKLTKTRLGSISCLSPFWCVTWETSVSTSVIWQQLCH